MLMELLAIILRLVLFLGMTLGVHMHCLAFHLSLTEIDMIGKVCRDHYVETRKLLYHGKSLMKQQRKKFCQCCLLLWLWRILPADLMAKQNQGFGILVYTLPDLQFHQLWYVRCLTVLLQKKSTNPLFPVAAGNGVSKFLEWRILNWTFLLSVFTQLNLSSWLMLLVICFAATDLLMDLSRTSSTNCYMLNGITMFCLPREKSPSNLTFSWKISCLIIWAAFASTMLFSMQEPSHTSNKALAASSSSESNMSRSFLLSHSQRIDSKKQSLNLALWMYLSTPCATRTCS